MTVIRIGLGWAQSHSFTTGQCPVIRYHRRLMSATLHDKVQIAKAVNATGIRLEDAPRGYRDFDKGAAKTVVLDPHGASLADRFLAGALDPAQAMAVLERVEQRFPDHLAAATRGETAVDASDISDALTATRTALATPRQTRQVQGEARGGQESFRYVAPAALVLVAVFGTMYLNDRRRGGYRAERLERVGPA